MEKIAMPAASLPGGGGAVKGIGETFQPNAFSGTATYTVPLPLTQGRGFVPQLALQYNSGGGNSSFGAGWNVQLPSITLRTEKGIPRYDGTDVYLYNGSEIVPKKGGQRTVTENGTDWTVTEYLPRTLSDYTRIEHWSDGDAVAVFWRTLSPANAITEFGRTAAARIADPLNDTRIFSWLAETMDDPKGNKIRFRYTPENGDQTGEFGRPGEAFSQKYLTSVSYGNYFGSGGAEKFAFEVVFDYGEHELGNLQQPLADPYATPYPWECRPDPFSSFRSGFGIRTYRRCKNILLFHCLEGENVGKPFLVNRCALTYYGAADYAGMPDQSGVISCLKTIRMTGCRIQGDGSYELLARPDLDFTFSQFSVPEDAAFKQLNVTGGSLPGSLSPDQFLPVDLYGEGIAGFLYTQDQGAYYYAPLGNGKYAAPELLPDFPVTGSGMIADLNGNGLPDMLVTQPQQAGYFENSPDGWKNYRPFVQYPSDSTGTESADFDADGKQDLLLADRSSVTLYPSLGTEGFGAPQQVPSPSDFPLQGMNSDTSQAEFVDVFGDGLPHRVSVSNGSVSCWPCLGYGVFDEAVTLLNAPFFESDFRLKNLFFTDLNGTGANDLVYVSATHVSIYLNHSGNGFGDPVTVELPEAYSDEDVIQFADIDGTGGNSLVFTKMDAQPRHYYLNFTGKTTGEETLKPYLLTLIDNNRGGKTALRYTSSVEFYLSDKRAGNPWVTRLHFPVQLLDRVTQSDEVSGTYYVQEFAYHDGYYDPVEREFRGFGFVETTDTQTYEAFVKTGEGLDFPVDRLNKELYVPPVYTKSWYNNGAFLSSGTLTKHYEAQFFSGDAHAYAFPDNVLAPEIYAADAETFREAYVALAGQLIRTEVYGLDGSIESTVPYAVEQSNESVVLIQPKGDNPYGVFRVDPREHIAYHYERNALDPRVQQDFTLEIDPLCGQVKQAVTVYVPRRAEAITGVKPHPEQLAPQAAITTTDYINTDDAANYWRGIEYQQQFFQLSGMTLGTQPYMDYATCAALTATALENTVVYGVAPTDGKVEALQFSWSRTYFWDGNQQNYLDLGEIGPQGLQAYQSQAQFSPEYIAAAYGGKLTDDVIRDYGGYVFDETTGYWWNNGAVQRYFDASQPELFYLPKQVYNPFAPADSALSVLGTTGYDSPYNMMAVELTEFIDPAAGIKNVQHIALDYSVFAPKQLIDVNGNVSQVLYDPLGQVTVSTIFKIRDAQPEGGMLLYPYDGFPAEYVPRTQLSDGSAITVAAIVGDPAYFVQGALSYFFYDEREWGDNRQPLAAVSVLRSGYYHDAENLPVYYPVKIEYTDGLGRIAEQKQLTDPGPAFGKVNGEVTAVQATQRWKVSGRTVYNNKGLAAEQYLQYFSDTFVYETQDEITAAGAVPPPSVLSYDATGRLIRTDEPKGLFSKTVFSPWDEAVFDANDTVLDAPYYIDFMAQYPANPTQEQQDEKDALEKAAKCYNTPVVTVFDSTGTQFLHTVNNLGRVTAAAFDGIAANSGSTSAEIFAALIAAGYLTAEGWLTAAFTPYETGFRLQLDPRFAPLLPAITALLLQGVLTTYIETDIQSRVLTQTDPRLYYSNQTEGAAYFSMRNRFEMGASAAHVTETPDAGLLLNFTNLFGLDLWTYTPRDYNQLIAYDRLQRRTELRVKRISDGDSQVPFGDYPLVETFTYGETVADAERNNLRGKLYELRDLSGIITQKSYDLKGQLTAVSRQMTRVYADAISWNDPATVPLDSELLETTYTFDALGMQVLMKTPDGTATNRSYTLSGLLKTISLVLPDNTQKPVINAIDYNAADQRLSVLFANTTSTRYTYETLTQRLLTLRNTRQSGEDLQHIDYTYDPVGNITRKRDSSRDVIFYNNQKVEPLQQYTYDILYRLVAADGYQHPGIQANTYQNNAKDGDFKQSRFTVSPADQSALENYSERYTYDNSGNLTLLKHTAVSASWTRDLSVEAGSNRLANMTYDPAGNLRQVQINKPVNLDYNCCNNLVKAGIITRPDQPDDADYYVYDSNEQRTRKVCESLTAGNTAFAIENTVYNGNYEVKRLQTADSGNNFTTVLERETLRIMDGAACVLVMHYWKLDSTGKEMATGDRSFRWQLGDQLASVTTETSDSAELISYEEYFPFGGTAIISGPKQQEVNLKTYRYSGKERDDTTGLYYYGHRYYATWLARWNKPDPAGAIDGLNLYAFVLGNPIVLKDADGLSATAKKKGAGKGPKKGPGKVTGVTKPTTERMKRDPSKTKKKRKEMSEDIRQAILDDYEDDMVKRKKIHQSDLYVGETEKVVSPNKKMSKERLLVRHIATALLSQNSEFIEVQAAISHKDKTIYVASNKKQAALFKLLPGQLKDFNVPAQDDENSSRVNRHLGKLELEKSGPYSDYKFVHISGLEEQHAETKIVEWTVGNAKPLDFIGGTRRPCFACSLFMSMLGISKTAYNQHPGAYWNSISALLSLAPHWDHYTKMAYAGYFYRNEGVSDGHVHDYDTDSEAED